MVSRGHRSRRPRSEPQVVHGRLRQLLSVSLSRASVSISAHSSPHAALGGARRETWPTEYSTGSPRYSRRAAAAAGSSEVGPAAAGSGTDIGPVLEPMTARSPDPLGALPRH